MIRGAVINKTNNTPDEEIEGNKTECITAIDIDCGGRDTDQ